MKTTSSTRCAGQSVSGRYQAEIVDKVAKGRKGAAVDYPAETWLYYLSLQGLRQVQIVGVFHIFHRNARPRAIWYRILYSTPYRENQTGYY